MAETVDEASDVASCEPISTSGFVVVKTLGKGKVFPVEDEIPDDMVLASDPAEDFRSLTMEMETRDAVDECSPRGVLEDCIRSSESEINSSKTSTSCSEANANQCVIANWQVFLRLWKHKSMRRLYAFPALSVGIGKLVRKRNRNSGGNKSSGSVLEDASLCLFKPSWSNFTLAELKAATNNFSSENIIGQGGFADVFKGCLQDGSHVAIKLLKKGTTEQMISDFLSELGIIVHIDHPNAAKLIGIGIEGGMHLVLQLSPHGSLATMLHGPKEKLTWSVRYKIALGTAEGLQYLHEGCQRRIIHRDIKAANILLTEDFEPQICDFGLAKWLPDQLTHHTVSHFEGTFGYLAPEYFTHGIVDEKIDVYAYGVLLLELISGREALDSSQQSLVMWAKPFLDKHEAKELVDPSLGDAYDSQKLNRVTLAASMCVQQSSILRPQMCQVVELLKAEGSLESAKLCRKATLKRTYSEELLDADEYNSTKNLDDLNRHRELALEL